MNTETLRALITEIRTDQRETAARLEQLNAVLDNMRALYPAFFGENSEDAVAPASGRVADPRIIESAKDSRWVVDTIFRRVRANQWLTPKEVTEAAIDLGWVPPAGSPDPVSVIRNYIKDMADLESHNRDGRTKEYRLKTPGDVASTTPPGTVTTERPGGDGHAAGPDSVSDHGEAFSGRNTRDHDRETANPVAIEF